MPNKPVLIYLAEVAHTGFGLSMRTCPLGVGVVGSYCKSLHQEAVNIRLFRCIEDLTEACRSQKPDIIGFGYFSWNDYLTLVASRVVRKLCPDALVVIGGANVGFYIHELNQKVFPDDFDSYVPVRSKPLGEGVHDFFYPVRDDLQLLREHPQVDLLVHGDGEIPFAEIVKSYLVHGNRAKVKRERLMSCSSLVEGEVLCGETAPLLYDLDKIPSPYVQGFYTEFFNRFQLVPQIETLRGCPFKCTFCTIGLQSGKLRRHSLEYTQQEILYLKDHSPNKVLRIADPNWGIVKHDVELAHYIHRLYATEGYPNSLRVYYSAGGPYENVKKMALVLRELLPLNMSFQSLTKEVLKNITRSNMPQERVQEMVRFAHEHRIATSTEFISNLPGETYQSFRECFLKAIDLRIDSIYTGCLYLIRGSELYSHESRKKYNFKTAYTLIEKDITKVEGKYVFEMDEAVTQTDAVTKEEFWDIHRFRLFAQLAHGAAFLKEIIMHGLNYGITPLDLHDELFAFPESYPFLNGITSEYIRNIRELYFDSPQELEATLTKCIEENGNVDSFYVFNHYIGAICKVQGVEEKKHLTSEMAQATGKLFDAKGKQREDEAVRRDFHAVLSALIPITQELIITPLESLEEEIYYECDYDLLAWAKDHYDFPLANYRLPKARRFAFVVRNYQEHQVFMEKTKGMTLLQRYNFYFGMMVSSNMRRYITYAEERTGHSFIKEAIAPMIT